MKIQPTCSPTQPKLSKELEFGSVFQSGTNNDDIYLITKECNGGVRRLVNLRTNLVYNEPSVFGVHKVFSKAYLVTGEE